MLLLKNMIQLDQFGFVCTNDNLTGMKEHTIVAWWETWKSSDHQMIVSHKGIVKEIDWKDLWNTMQLIRLVPHILAEINEKNDMSDTFVRNVLSVLSRYTWYDEVSNQNYCYIPKLTGTKLTETFNQIDFFCDNYTTNIINESRWWFVIGRDITLTDEERSEYSLAQFFGLCFVYGKPTVSKEILTAYKIQVPILRYDIVEQLDSLIMLLRNSYFVVNAHYNESQQVYEITTNDYDLLAYIRILYGDDMNASLIDKVLDLQKEIYIQYGISSEYMSMRWKLYEVKR